MRKRTKDIVWVIVLSIACGLIVWQAVHWHSNLMFLEMFQWLHTGKSYVTVLYNLGLMVVTGIVVGSLMVRITNLIGCGDGETPDFDEDGGSKPL